MRRSAELERVVERAELACNVLFGVACDLERLYHDVEVVVADSAGGKLNAVAYDVVLISEDIQRILVQQCVQTALRHGERVVREDDLAGLLVQLVHREVNDEAQFEAALIDEVHALCDLGADLSGELRSVLLGVGDEVKYVAFLELAACRQLLALVVVEEFVDRAVVLEHAVLARLNLEVAQTLHADFLYCEVLHALEEGLGLLSHSGNADTAYGLVAEGLEVAVNEQVGKFLDDQRVAQVGLV